jgi:hypothetical protein
VIGCIRFRIEIFWRTMDREASTKVTAAPGYAGAETCGGVMGLGPKSGNGTRSSVHCPDSAELARLGLGRWTARRIRWPQACWLTARSPQIRGSAAGGCRRQMAAVAAARRPLDCSAGHRVPRYYRDRLQPGLGLGGWRDGAGDRRRAVSRHFGRGLRHGVRQGVPGGSARRVRGSGSRPSRPSYPPTRTWAGMASGQLNLQSLQVAGITVENSGHAVVTLLP